MHAVLGVVRPHWAGELLGTGYEEFVSPLGISGLARVAGDRLDVLAVVAQSQGSGQFRDFINAAKACYATVCVWEDWNPAVGDALRRYGFKRAKETSDGETVTGWRWDRPRNPHDWSTRD